MSQEALEAAFTAFGQFESFALHRNRVAFIEWKEVKHAEAARAALNKTYVCLYVLLCVSIVNRNFTENSAKKKGIIVIHIIYIMFQCMQGRWTHSPH